MPLGRHVTTHIDQGADLSKDQLRYIRIMIIEVLQKDILQKSTHKK